MGDNMTKKALSVFAVLVLMATLSVNTLAKEITVRGKLQKTVESGGWLIAGEKQKYLILNARRFQNETWFKESTEVEAVGEVKTDVMTIYMEGTPFEVRTMHPVEQGSTTQRVTAGLTTRVTVSGDSIVQAQPDTAILTLSVVTQARRALDAQQENANRSDAVVKALKATAGSGAEVKTSGYSLQPQRIYKEGQPPTITGYEARNTVTVTLSDLTKVGQLIDAASQVGANDISGIAFTLRQDRPARNEALRQATREAVDKAQVIANALGGKVVRIIEVQEEGTVRPLPVYETMDKYRTASAAATPIEVGTLDITSRVQLIAEVEAG
jgi:uncharacterized protein YggE